MTSQQELDTLAPAARERRSVDAFARAALGGFIWAVIAGVCGKLVWDSARVPLFLYPLALVDALLFADAARSYLYARRELARELRLESRIRELRLELGVDSGLGPASAKLKGTGT